MAVRVGRVQDWHVVGRSPFSVVVLPSVAGSDFGRYAYCESAQCEQRERLRVVSTSLQLCISCTAETCEYVE